MCCQTGMSCRGQKTWHPIPSQYTDTGSTCRCAIHLCGTSHWNTQLSNFYVLGQTRSENPSPTFHIHQRTLNFMILSWWWSVRSSVESVLYPPSLKPVTCGVRIHYAIHSPTAASLDRCKQCVNIPISYDCKLSSVIDSVDHLGQSWTTHVCWICWAF